MILRFIFLHWGQPRDSNTTIKKVQTVTEAPEGIRYIKSRGWKLLNWRKMSKYIYIFFSGGPLSALTCCVKVRLLSAIKKISPLIYSQSGLGAGSILRKLWWLSPWYFSADVYLAELHCRGRERVFELEARSPWWDRLLTAGLCGNTIGQDIQTPTYHSSTSNMAFHLKDVCSSNFTWPLNMMLT